MPNNNKKIAKCGITTTFQMSQRQLETKDAFVFQQCYYFIIFFICCNYTHLVSKYWVNNKSSDSLFSFIFYFYATLLHYASGQS